MVDACVVLLLDCHLDVVGESWRIYSWAIVHFSSLHRWVKQATWLTLSLISKFQSCRLRSVRVLAALHIQGKVEVVLGHGLVPFSVVKQVDVVGDDSFVGLVSWKKGLLKNLVLTASLLSVHVHAHVASSWATNGWVFCIFTFLANYRQGRYHIMRIIVIIISLCCISLTRLLGIRIGRTLSWLSFPRCRSCAWWPNQEVSLFVVLSLTLVLPDFVNDQDNDTDYHSKDTNWAESNEEPFLNVLCLFVCLGCCTCTVIALKLCTFFWSLNLSTE